MQKRYTRKSEIRVLLDETLRVYNAEGLDAFSEVFHEKILHHRVKFPLLEFCGQTIHKALNSSDLIPFLDVVCERKTEGGNVILGIILQGYLRTNFRLAMDKATAYIADADQWYVCDIIGERVFGFSLLTNFKETFPIFQKLSQHESNWVVRSLGAGSHNAIRKGLEKPDVNCVFQLLMTMANTNDKEIRQGVGWAAKTTAKFHPDIIEEHRGKVYDQSALPNWFRRKVEIGLNRNAYNEKKRS